MELDAARRQEPLVQHVTGLYHSCGIKTDGTLACWGNNSVGQLDNIPSGEFTEISVGYYHTCGIRADGSLACWGNNASNQLNVPSGTFTRISAGSHHTCGVKADGTLACWGNNFFNQLDNVPSGTFNQIGAGARHTCGIRADGSLACWGDNGSGQLSNIPSGTFFQIGTGALHACGIKGEGTLTCWGNNGYGQLNNVPAGTFTQISAGERRTCGTKADGYIACWGSNGNKLGGPPTFTSSAPPDGAIGTSYSHTVTAGPAGGPTATFAVAGGALPDGLQLDPVSGEISGTPTDAGTFTGQITATNGMFGPDATQGFSIEIAKAMTSLSGTASAGGDLGTALHDSATLSDGDSPTGSITFDAYGPGDDTCSDTPVFTDSQPVSGNGDVDSDPFTPTAPGTYRWIASYSGDANNEASSTACGDAGQSAALKAPLDVATSGTGVGYVASTPAGIDCGSGSHASCSASYGYGTEITLTAVPDEGTGSSFDGWSGGGCSGTETTCAVTMDQVRSVSASFTDQAPGITALKVTPKSFTPSGKPTDLQRRAAKGATIEITLSEPALVSFRVKNAKPGKAGGPPPPPSRPRSFSRNLPAGSSTVPFSGKLAERTFKPRRYRLIARAIDSANQKSEKVSARFRVVG
ncbi:MAG: putative Ig domain-containing protein [Solirubrobacterales bacterium]|nr:putative Ig domain-containing protein [Solirubrobacterales bacterium]